MTHHLFSKKSKSNSNYFSRMSAAGGFVPDMGRRGLMNGLLLGSVAGPLLVLPAVLISFLVPAKSGGGGGGTIFMKLSC